MTWAGNFVMANVTMATNLQDQSSPPSQAPEQSLLTEAMIEEQSLFRLIIDRIPGQIAVMTAGGGVELVNRQILEYFGKATEELKNWATSNSFHPDDILPTIDAWKRALETGQPFEFENRGRRADGVWED